MRTAPALLITAALAIGAAFAFADEGVGPVEGDVVRIDDLRLGDYWYGAEISQEDLVGKVVLVEMWGS